jgi:hypothetical protein
MTNKCWCGLAFPLTFTGTMGDLEPAVFTNQRIQRWGLHSIGAAAGTSRRLSLRWTRRVWQSQRLPAVWQWSCLQWSCLNAVDKRSTECGGFGVMCAVTFVASHELAMAWQVGSLAVDTP